MKKPLIAIVTTKGPDPGAEERDIFYVGKPYVDCIIAAGGVPILIPHGADMKDLIDLLDGWMIIGGRDIDPAHYGQELHPLGETEVMGRFESEKELYESAPESMPILGICYGCQFLNVVKGGDLIQHLPDVAGTGLHNGGTLQYYEVESGTKVAGALGADKVSGKSYHHQAIGKIGNGLKVVAKSEDGTVEAVEDVERRWVLGVQWHPERTPDDPASQSLFREFILQASQYQKEKESCGTW